MDQLVAHCAGLPLALTVVGKVVGNKRDKRPAAETAHKLLDGKVAEGADVETELHSVLESCMYALKPALQNVIFDIVWLYAPMELPWSMVEAAVDEGSYFHVSFFTCIC